MVRKYEYGINENKVMNEAKLVKVRELMRLKWLFAKSYGINIFLKFV